MPQSNSSPLNALLLLSLRMMECKHQRSLLPLQNSPVLLLKTFRSSSIVSDMIQVTATIHANSVKHTPRMMSAHCSLLLIFINRLCHTPSIPQAMDTLKSKCDFDLSSVSPRKDTLPIFINAF